MPTTEFSVALENRPGTLAELCELLSGADINIEALAGVGHGDEGLVFFVVDKPELADDALSLAGIEFSVRNVLRVDVLDEPGKLGDVARVMFEAGINIESVYVATNGQVILGVDDYHGATQVASGLAAYS
jgi:hypothetical protein